MRHTREAVIARAEAEFARLDAIVTGLADHQWQVPLTRSETKDPWTVKDAVAHVTHWKADQVRRLRGRRRPPEERGLTETQGNHLVYERWRHRPSSEVLDWHREVQQELLVALREAPDELFSGRERGPAWPYDIDGHSADHRVRDLEHALLGSTHR